MGATEKRSSFFKRLLREVSLVLHAAVAILYCRLTLIRIIRVCEVK